MCKWMLDSNVLYCSSGEQSIFERLKEKCPNLFWSEISLEELIAGADSAEKYEVLKKIFKKTSGLNLVVPDTQNFLLQEWGLEPVSNLENYSLGLMEAVNETLKTVSFDHFRDFMVVSKGLCEAKREIFNVDFIRIAEATADDLKKDGVNIENENLKNKKILEMFYRLLDDESLKKLLGRIKKSAYSIKSGVLDDAGFDVKGLRELGQREDFVIVPEITEKEFVEKKSHYECYIRVYAGYCARRMYQTSKSKYKNDSHDLDIMKYLSLGFSIVTAEKRWEKICRGSGLITKYLFRTGGGTDLHLIENNLT